jgi:hypothetical protein
MQRADGRHAPGVRGRVAYAPPPLARMQLEQVVERGIDAASLEV